MHKSLVCLALLTLVVSVSAFLPGGGEKEMARAELERLGMEGDALELVLAVQKGDRALVDLLLAAGASPDGRDDQDRTPIMIALDSGRPDLAERLIEAGANLRTEDGKRSTVLTHAVEAAETSIVKLLLEKGVSPNTRSPLGGRVVAEAARQGRLASAKLLLEFGASPNGQDDEGAPLIFHATSWGAEWMVKGLIERGVVVGERDNQGNSIAHSLVKNESDRLDLLPDEVDLNAVNEYGETPLHVAILEGRSSLVPTLLEHGASVMTSHPSGWSSLHLALQRGDTEMVDSLLKHGADPNRLGPEGRSTMDLVLALDSPPEQLNSLLREGLDPHTKGPDDRTPLETVLAKRDIRSAKFLITYGADPGFALYNAAVEGDQEVFEMLLQVGAELNKGPRESPLMAAVRGGHEKMVERLLESGVSAEQMGTEGQSALHLAVAMDHAKITRHLLVAGADPNGPYNQPISSDFSKRIRDRGYIKWQFKYDRRITPLMVAADGGNLDLARALIDHGAKKNVWTKRKSYYVIGFAARREDVKMMQLLLGVDPDNERRWAKIDLSEQKAYVYDRKTGEQLYETKVSTGKKGHRTRLGEFVVTNRHRHHVSNIYKGAKMPYFQRFSCGDFGFHEGYCPGYAASHGCIRVPKGNAAKLWEILERGDRVVIVE